MWEQLRYGSEGRWGGLCTPDEGGHAVLGEAVE